MFQLFSLISQNFLPRIKFVTTNLYAGVFSLHVQPPMISGFENNQANQNQPWIHLPGCAPRFDGALPNDCDGLPF